MFSNLILSWSVWTWFRFHHCGFQHFGSYVFTFTKITKKTRCLTWVYDLLISRQKTCDTCCWTIRKHKITPRARNSGITLNFVVIREKIITAYKCTNMCKQIAPIYWSKNIQNTWQPSEPKLCVDNFRRQKTKKMYSLTDSVSGYPNKTIYCVEFYFKSVQEQKCPTNKYCLYYLQ